MRKTSTDIIISGENHVRKNVLARLSHISEIKLLIFQWLLLVVALFMFALTQAFWYSSAHTVSSYSSGGTYTEGTLGKISSLNPLFASTNSEKTLEKLLFSSLTTTDASGVIGNDLAASVASDSSGKVWTVKLRPNLKWSDDEPLTNQDVLFTISLLKNPAVVSTFSSVFDRVNVFEDSSGSIIFELPSAYPDFATALDFPVLPEHVLKDADPATLLESPFSTKPVTSGPFAYNATQSIQSSGEAVVYLTANKNYYKGVPKISSFVVHAYSSLEDIVKALNSGAISATAELSPTSSSQVEKTSVYEKQTAINSGVFLFLNTKSPVLSQKSVRKAIQSGLNRDDLRALLGDEPALDYPILSSQLSLSSWPELPALDVAGSKETISSLEDKRLSLVTINSGYFPALADNVASQLESLGFSVDKQLFDPGADFLANVVANRSYDLLLYEVDLGLNPDLLVYYHSSQVGSSGLNLSNYVSSVADDLILSAREASSEDVKNSKYEAFLKRWLEDVPSIALYQVNMSYYFDHTVKTFSEDLRLAAPTDRFSDVRFWASEKSIKNRTP